MFKFKYLFYEKIKEFDTNLPCGAISFGRVIYKDDEKILLSTKSSYQVLNKGEFLINPLNLNYDLKSLRIALSDKDVVVSSGYIIIKNKLHVEKTYFDYLLHIFDVLFMKTLGAGVRQTLSFNHIANCLLPSPPLSEQEGIANYLDKQTAKVDGAIVLQEAKIEKLKEYKTSLINAVVTGKMKVE